MTSQKNDTGFDAFFHAVTESPEFRANVTKDWNPASLTSLESSLQEIEKNIGSATQLVDAFDQSFRTEDAKKIGENAGKTGGNKTGNEKEEKTPPIEVRRFTKKGDEKLWGFQGIAGMDTLKRELTESFIQPLRFKFLIEKYRARSPGEDAIASEGDISLKNIALLEKLYTEYERFKISIPTGILFYGPPGTGKTFITKKLAEELECGFVSKNMGEFGSSYLHQTTQNIRDFFTQAKKASEKEPIILFLDEIDALVSARTDRVDANKAEEVSQFLQEFNALEDAKNLIVITATNRPDHLDSALLRSGRLDKKLYIGPPDLTARKELFRMYIEKFDRPHAKLDYEELGVLTDGYVSADIEMMCDEAARDASQRLLDLVDEAESGALPENFARGNRITMELLRSIISETPSSLSMVDMSIYEKWGEKIARA